MIAAISASCNRIIQRSHKHATQGVMSMSSIDQILLFLSIFDRIERLQFISLRHNLLFSRQSDCKTRKRFLPWRCPALVYESSLRCGHLVSHRGYYVPDTVSNVPTPSLTGSTAPKRAVRLLLQALLLACAFIRFCRGNLDLNDVHFDQYLSYVCICRSLRLKWNWGVTKGDAFCSLFTSRGNRTENWFDRWNACLV